MVGIEPTQTVLETVVLPLYDTPNVKHCSKYTKNRELFALGMGGILLAEAAIFAQFKLFFHLFLVALGVVCDASTGTALELRHVVFDLAHTFQ